MTDDEIAEFLRGKHTMSLASINADGSIHLVAMWYGFLEGEIAFETKAKSQKVANLRRNPNITCMVEDGDDLQRARGRADHRHRRDLRGPRPHARDGQVGVLDATSVPTPTTCSRRSR